MKRAILRWLGLVPVAEHQQVVRAGVRAAARRAENAFWRGFALGAEVMHDTYKARQRQGLEPVAGPIADIAAALEQKP